MFRIDDVYAAPALPAPPTDATVGSPGYWTGGNPASVPPVLPTRQRYHWYNMLQEELMSILAAAAIAPSRTIYNQVLTALRALFTPKGTYGAWTETYFTVAAGTGGTVSYTTTLSFTAPCAGYLHVVSSVSPNPGSFSSSCQQLLSVDSTALGSDSTVVGTSHSGTILVAAGAHTITATLNAPPGLGAATSVGQNLSYLFVPA